MTRISSYLLLVLFLFNIILFYPVFLMFQSGIRNEFAGYSEKQNNAQKITIFSVNSDSKSDWQWIEKNEFRRNDTLYDVVKKEIHGNTIQYFCYADKNEMKLFEGLSHFIKNITDTQNPGKKETKNPGKEFFKDYFPTEEENRFLDFNRTVKPNIPVLAFLSFIPEKISPPPKHIIG